MMAGGQERRDEARPRTARDGRRRRRTGGVRRGARAGRLRQAGTAPAVPAVTATTATPAAKVRAAPPQTAHRAHAGAGIAWQEPPSDRGRPRRRLRRCCAPREHGPVFVYWGAVWCPPCNQVKATIFNRQDFIERSRFFVPVYIDGDSPSAQRLGARFSRSAAIRRWSCSRRSGHRGHAASRARSIAARHTEVLTLGMNAARPVGAVLADALAKPAALDANDWRLLAFYSWDTDQQQIIDKKRLPATLLALADACPADAPDTAMRLRLKALAAADAKAPPKVDATTRSGSRRVSSATRYVRASRPTCSPTTRPRSFVPRARRPRLSARRCSTRSTSR